MNTGKLKVTVTMEGDKIFVTHGGFRKEYNADADPEDIGRYAGAIAKMNALKYLMHLEKETETTQ